MRPLIIGVAGGTGSGKTTVAQHLANSLPKQHVTVLQHDSYYRDYAELCDEERRSVNYDHPDALETELLVQHLRDLEQGLPVDIPIYDFSRHRRSQETRHIAVTKVVVVEGILVLADRVLRDLMAIRIFVDTDADIRVFRRIRRDLEHRGRSFESIREQYYATVRPMHLQFVEPSKRWADIIVPEGARNAVALDLLTTKLRAVLSDSGDSAFPPPRFSISE
ncbi:MAG: uridine kinase [Myxococcota bacterium]